MTDMIKRDDALEPCPFCRGEEVTTWFDREQGEKWGYASCDGCAARGPEVRTNWDREPDAPWHSEAIAAWNTRADRIKELVKERDLWRSRYEHHNHERLETLNLNAMQASKIGSLMNTIAKLEKKISKLEKAE